MIPLYVLIGVWGGPGRLGATVKFVIYTMAGSLLMLVSVIVFGLSSRARSTSSTAGTSDSTLALPRLRGRLRGQGAALPVPRLAAGRLPRVVAGGGRSAFGRDLESGGLRLPPHLRSRSSRARRTTSGRPILALAAVGSVYGSLLAFRAPDIRGVIAYSSLAQMGLITIGVFAFNDSRRRRRHSADGQPRPALGDAFPARGRRSSGAPRPASSTRLGGMARGRPALATLLMATGIIALAVPGSVGVRGRVPDPGAVSSTRAGAGRSSARPRSCSRRCTCCD